MGRRVLPGKGTAEFLQQGHRRHYDVCGVRLAVDLHLAPGQPLVMIIPGWLGSATSTYVISAARCLHQAGFAVARINLRDHGETAHLNQGLFNSALIDEVVGLVDALAVGHGGQGTGLLGYSLGGNFALRVARARPGVPVLAVCPAIEPAGTTLRIDRNPVYQRYFVRKWRQAWRQKQSAFPADYDFGAAMRLSSVSALTDYFVRYHSPFASTADYFNAYDLSGSALRGVAAQILAARDDPIIDALHYERLPESLTIDMTTYGGHGAYLKSWKLESWVDDYLLAYFAARLPVQRVIHGANTSSRTPVATPTMPTT